MQEVIQDPVQYITGTGVLLTGGVLPSKPDYHPGGFPHCSPEMEFLNGFFKSRFLGINSRLWV
jgi:hypothetical protein